MESEEIKVLIKRYQMNQLSTSEVRKLKAWVNTQVDEDLEADIKLLWENYRTIDTHNHNEAYDRVLNNVYLKKAKSIKHGFIRVEMLSWITRVSACLFLPLLFFSLFFFYQQKMEYESIMEQSYMVKTDKGERSTLILPDGTKVFLNHSSCLTYQSTFSKVKREVQLLGEAYFEVTHDMEKTPFIVQTEKADIRVWGTTFNVSAYASDNFFETSLVEGLVEVIPSQSAQKALFLKPNQKLCFDKQTHLWKISTTDLWLETAWKRGDIIFRSERLNSIMNYLENYYGVNIRIVGECPIELFTGSFHEDNVCTVLKILQQHYTFEFEKSGREIRILF